MTLKVPNIWWEIAEPDQPAAAAKPLRMKPKVEVVGLKRKKVDVDNKDPTGRIGFPKLRVVDCGPAVAV